MRNSQFNSPCQVERPSGYDCAGGAAGLGNLHGTYADEIHEISGITFRKITSFAFNSTTSTSDAISLSDRI